MSIEVNIPPELFQFTDGRQVVEVDGGTVGQCLDDLIRQFPGLKKWLSETNGKIRSYLDIYINEESAFPEGLTKPVKEGDKLDIILIIGGG
ncbi:MAG: MoaD/ThiS family protein [Dehalococcoidales bacterium]|nr:MoaD/ThiS family protein [Dehalococcoidales bacterium]